MRQPGGGALPAWLTQYAPDVLMGAMPVFGQPVQLSVEVTFEDGSVESRDVELTIRPTTIAPVLERRTDLGAATFAEQFDVTRTASDAGRDGLARAISE